MKAVVFESKNRISVKTLPEPEACRGEVVVRIASSGICETDVWVYRSGAFARPGMVLGHMAGGEIVYVGVDVDGWRSGERVAIDPRVYCGQCLACRGGHATMCERRFAEGAGTWIGLDALRKAEEGELYLQSKTDTENVELKVVDRELLRRIEEMERRSVYWRMRRAHWEDRTVPESFSSYGFAAALTRGLRVPLSAPAGRGAGSQSDAACARRR